MLGAKCYSKKDKKMGTETKKKRSSLADKLNNIINKRTQLDTIHIHAVRLARTPSHPADEGTRYCWRQGTDRYQVRVILRSTLATLKDVEPYIVIIGVDLWRTRGSEGVKR